MPTLKASTATPRQDLMAALQMTALDFVPIGTQVMTPIKAPHMRGSFGVIPLAALLARADVKRTRKSGANRTDWEYEEKTYKCLDYAHEEPATDGDRAFYGSMFDYEKVLAARGRNIILREQEVRIVAQVLDTVTNFTGATNTAAASVIWSTAATADPLGDINNAKIKIRGKCGLTPDTLVIPWQSVLHLSACNQVRNALAYTARPEGALPLDELARALGVKRILTPGDAALYNSAKEGQTASLSEIWTSSKAGLYVTAAGEDVSQPCIGRTYHWEGMGGLLEVDQYREEQTESDIYRVKQSVQENFFDAAFGFVITGVGA